MADSPIVSLPASRRIAHVLPWPTVGGTEIATLRIIKALDGPDFEHVAFCTSDAAAVESFFHAAGVATATYRSVELSYRRPGPFLKASAQLAAQLRHHRAALVHCSDLLACLRAAPAAKLAGLPVVCHVRSSHSGVSRHDRLLLFAVDRLIFVSRHTWATFASRVRPSRGSVVYDGITSTRIDREAAQHRLRTQFSIPPHAKLVGTVGRLAPQKDYPTLIKAAAQVLKSQPDVRFLVIGDHIATPVARQHYQTLTSLLDALGIRQHFVFTGFRDDIPELLSGLDVFVLSTHVEGLPLVILEAMAQHTPVIATAVGGVPEVVFDRDTGLLHRHEDEAHLASQILSLLSDEALRQRLADAGHRLAEQRFTTQQLAAGIAAVYRSALS